MARCAHNLGFVAGRGGDVPAALRWFDEAERRYREAEPGGAWHPVLEVDRAELLLSAGLAAEARTRARVAVDALVGQRQRGRGGRGAAARRRARRSRPASTTRPSRRPPAPAEAFRRQRRASWALLADAVGARRARGGRRRRPARPRARRHAAGAAARARRPPHRRRARRTSSRAAWRWPPAIAPTARSALAAVGRARPGQPALLRIQAWHATALLRALEGDRAGARRAVSAGLRVLDGYRQTFGAEELRAGVAVHGVGLARVAVRLALEADDAWAALAAVESVRAASLELPPARPPRDDELAAQPRRAARPRRRPARRPDRPRVARPSAAPPRRAGGRGPRPRADPGRRRRAGVARPAAARRAAGRARWRDAARVLRGGRHAARHRGGASGRASLHRLGAADDAAAETAALLFALRRLVRRGRSDAATAAAAGQPGGQRRTGRASSCCRRSPTTPSDS